MLSDTRAFLRRAEFSASYKAGGPWLRLSFRVQRRNFQQHGLLGCSPGAEPIFKCKTWWGRNLLRWQRYRYSHLCWRPRRHWPA